jgi:glutamyl/glutaminyl-tRNA synthetase
MNVRVRFAPSPTGYLHIGGARTALFNWLYARHTGGTFVLRIEDTDAARNTQEATEVIFRGLKWLGLDWDEGPLWDENVEGRRSKDEGQNKQAVDSRPSTLGSKGDFGPYFQSQRSDIYRKRIAELRDRGMAYEHEGAIKFKMQREPILIPDIVVGDVRRELTDREALDPDFVIVRSDGQPVFHLVNVIDDLEMKITHVIRGEDHLSNTAKHIALFRAFGVEPPKYAHIPLILNGDGSKMSKRDVGASMRTYMDEGFAPEAVVNYLALLGWSPKENREKMPIAEIIQRFDVPQILRHNARFDMTKLLWLDGEYLREMADEKFHAQAVDALQRAGVDLSKRPADYVKAAIATCKGKIKKFNELPAYAGFYFKDDVTIDPAIFTQENQKRLRNFRHALAALADFKAATVEQTIKAIPVKEVRNSVIACTRMACTGAPHGPSLYHLMEILGRETVLERLDNALLQGIAFWQHPK